MPKVKTITLDGSETEVKFPDSYPYYIITNMGDSELYASGNPGITAYADGVYTVLPGMETRISPEHSPDTVYLLGSGMVQVRAEEIAVPTSFRAVPKGGDSDGGATGVTDYSLLTNKPSIKGVTLDGNKTLAELGINYPNLSNKPTVSGQSTSNCPNGWIRACSITNARIGGSFIVKIDRSNTQFNLQDAPSTTLIGVLSYGFVDYKPQASFKILNNAGKTTTIPQIRFSITTYGTNKTIYIDAYINDIYGQPLIFEIWFNPSLFDQSTVTTPFTTNPTVPSDFSAFTFQNKMETITVDTALSDTSENPVQNKVLCEAINDLSYRISQLEQKE